MLIWKRIRSILKDKRVVIDEIPYSVIDWYTYWAFNNSGNNYINTSDKKVIY